MDLSLNEIIMAMANFLLMVVILNKFLYKPIVKVLDERKESIQGNLDEAEKTKTDAEGIKKEYQEQLKSARKEAQDIITKATKLGDESKEDLLRQAKIEADKISQRAKEDIEREKGKAISEVRDEVANLSISVAEKILGQKLEKKNHEKMIHDFVKEVGDSK
ncbi:F-type H+-transporting ATPase subunit b [Desulfonispora thiosulfatigenes DSM 11270]|uniref:ATP synthase subunit b n=1 Tax=Desulfonispora thiosulfatigenes DSM 11270 TaxID=656914 RepID=A0A1W1V496_DESTI|nr:F0F1 ATP synthase subunit B [Desulfonispora thiosulfatigenes]SMB88209.1 F-type H+-transporting ATPase subunit b [Desulfonispora thiosulfatigenes DSM 11270]